jgi:hypothetical protein
MTIQPKFHFALEPGPYRVSAESMEESIAELWQEDIISTIYSPLSGMASVDLGEP